MRTSGAAAPKRRQDSPIDAARTLHGLLVAVIAVALCALPVPASATPALPDLNKEYWFGNWEIAHLWQEGAQGQGVTVAVVDTGVQATIPDLAGVVLPGTDFKGGDARTDTDVARGHGTAMALFIAGQGRGPNHVVGVAPAAKILPIK